MRHIVPRIRLVWLVAAALLVFGSTATAQVSVDELLEGLGDFVKKKDDQFAVGVIQQLGERYSELDEKMQKKVIKELERCLGKSRADEDSELYIATVQAFASMGELGAKATTKALKNKNVKKRPEVLSAALLSLSQHKDPKDVKTLVDFLVHKDPPVVASAAEALGVYADQPEKVRKSIVQELVKNYATYESMAISNPREPVYQDRLRQVERPMQSSLEALTKAKGNQSAADWQAWYNDNKRKKWDDPDKG